MSLFPCFWFGWVLGPPLCRAAGCRGAERTRQHCPQFQSFFWCAMLWGCQAHFTGGKNDHDPLKQEAKVLLTLDHPMGSTQAAAEPLLLLAFSQFCHTCLPMLALLVLACTMAFLSPFCWCRGHFCLALQFHTLSIASVPLGSEQTPYLFLRISFYCFLSCPHLTSLHRKSHRFSFLLVAAWVHQKSPQLLSPLRS